MVRRQSRGYSRGNSRTLIRNSPKYESERLGNFVDGVVPLSGLGDFPVASGNELERLQYYGGKVFINTTQYFGNVPAEVWNFYIGGYQPAQKWLKDRRGRKLNFNEIEHYQKIVRILKETGEIMQEIDKIARETAQKQGRGPSGEFCFDLFISN